MKKEGRPSYREFIYRTLFFNQGELARTAIIAVLFARVDEANHGRRSNGQSASEFTVFMRNLDDESTRIVREGVATNFMERGVFVGRAILPDIKLRARLI